MDVYLQASLGLLYGDRGDAWVTEETPLAQTPLAAAVLDADKLVSMSGANGLPVVTLRLGMVYGRDAWHTQMLAAQAQKRALVIVGDGMPYWSLLHAEDAGRAIALAVDDAEAGAIYNVADDRPTRMADLVALVARLAGAPEPNRVPALLARMMVGADVVQLLTTSVRLSNRAIKQDLELSLHYPTPEEGFREVLSTPMPAPESDTTKPRVDTGTPSATASSGSMALHARAPSPLTETIATHFRKRGWWSRSSSRCRSRYGRASTSSSGNCERCDCVICTSASGCDPR